jgi:hypothetical protein
VGVFFHIIIGGIMVTNNDILPNYDGMTSSAKADYDVTLQLIYRFY